MSGILIPEMVIYQTLENITEYIRQDLANAEDDSVTMLYRLLGLDDDGNLMKINRYNYFVQAKKIFSNPKNLSVNFGYNFEVAKIISFHIILPSEQPYSTPIGEDEGYQTEIDDDGNVQMKFCQIFSSNYQIMITSDNMSEVNLVYHIYKSLMIALVPHLSLKGLLNPKFSGNDIVFQDDTIPAGIFHKVLNLQFEYELVVPQLLISQIAKAIDFEPKPIDSGEDTIKHPSKRIEVGRSVVNTISEGLPMKEIEMPLANISMEKNEHPTHIVSVSRNNLMNDGREYPPYHVISGLLGEDHTLRDIHVCVTDTPDYLVPGVVVELRSEHYIYHAITNENGIAIFPRIADDIYTVTFAKSGYNQVIIPDIEFLSPDTYIQYSLVNKNIWDGMHADTHPIMYVDIHNGGRAGVNSDNAICGQAICGQAICGNYS